MNVRRLLADGGLFALGAVLLYVVVRYGVPPLAQGRMDSFIAWMILAVPCLFAPLIFFAWLLLRSERDPRPLVQRLRLRPLTRRDWRWIGAGLAATMIASGALTALCAALNLDIDPFEREPRAFSEAWMFALWLVYWPFNILGEELAWRAVVLPRMEAQLGSRAWLLNAALWLLFHLGFGAGNMLVVAPTVLVTPWLAQRLQSTWVAVVLHAGVSLPGMIAIALGYV